MGRNCLMFKKWSILLALTAVVISAYPQNDPADTSIAPTSVLSDTSILDYEELFRDFDAFMDSILSPHSFFLASLSMGKGYYNFESKTSTSTHIETSKRLTYSPTIGYFHKGGLGISTTGYIVHDKERMNFFQVGVTPSFDYLANRSFATGISYTRFFTRDSLPFYTTPLQNELYAYFIYRSWWLRPSVSTSYGWGNRSDFRERESLIQDLRLRRYGYTYTNTQESIRDFSITASVRHDFYWLDVFTFRDHIRFTPQVAFTSGTQKFGFNQSSTTYGTLLRTASNVLFSSENVYLDNELQFQPLALTLYLRSEYSIGKFFMQPQFTLDYYFPATENNLNALFSLNVGCIF
jgi:hypothetical protein